MVQYGVWPNCCNACDFCLRKQREYYTKEQQLYWLDAIKKNIDCVDWEDEFSSGISLLGGELYFITDKDLQDSFLELIDIIIEKILKVSKNPSCKYSTVTNGMYNPEFLFRVIDKIVNSVGIEKVDINFSYDLKYRFKTEESAKLVLENIRKFNERYKIGVGVQMILTQYLINFWKEGKFEVNEFIQENIPGNILCFLYPHPVHTGKVLDDFNFNRKDFLKFIRYLKNNNEQSYLSFVQSTKNSGTFKYTGLINKNHPDLEESPILSDGKEELLKCGHSVLYKCYTDSDRCLLCDLNYLDKEGLL